MLHAQQNDTVKKETEIEQVVLIGYGKQKKSDLTGSITSITAKDFNSGASTPAQLIQGKTPGVQITNNSGAPGAGSSIRIRGIGSLNGSQSPLIVIDGVPQDFGGINGAADPLSLINPNDIQSFDILKDASATAIYGNRASNGVILVTTKQGSAGKLKVNFTTMASVSTKMGNVDVLDADQYRSFVNEIAATNTTVANQAFRLGTANTNWQDEIYQKAWGTDNNIALSGGIKNLPYRLSIGYNEQNGIVKTNSFRRTSVGLNLNPKFFDNHLAVNVNLKGTFSDNQFVPDGVIPNATYFDPTQPVFSGNSNYGGYYEWLDAGSATGLNVNSTANPLAQLAAVRNVSSVWRALGNVQIDYKFHFLPDLHFNVNAGYDYAKSNGATTVNGAYKSGIGTLGTFREYSQEKKNRLLETYFNYVKNIEAIDTNVDVVAGYAYQNFQTLTPYAVTYNGNGQNQDKGIDFSTRNVLLSFYGRGIFTIANKYIISASIRRDGSSRFYNGTRDNLWGNFPGVSLAWKINEENFLKDTGINTLKLRAGWGKTGNQELNTGDYPSFANYTISQPGAQYQFGSQYYYMYRPNIYNPILSWEDTTTQNLGVDFGFAHNRITGSVDIFKKKSEGLLVDAGIAAGDLSNHNVLNAGNMDSKGIEGSITIIPIKTQNTTWEVSFNATHYDSKITNLIQGADDSYFLPVGGISGGVGNTIQAHAVGYQPYAFLVYQQVYGSNGKPLDGVYVDRNGDGIVNASDRYYYQSTQPDAILGFNTKLNYKNWDFGLSARAIIGNYVYNNAASNSSVQSLTTNSYLQNIYSSAAEYRFSAPQYFSDIFVENASFLRLDNVNLGYNFKDILSKGSSLRVYGMAQNVFVITKYSGVDPEVFNGIDNGYYQMPKIYSVGLNFQF
ncbi:SusC/RagA family TonB-linked outer membrane protein [Epilithonimonas sp. UC225_85]|uniref:SusC/RagA family TonB-linked outer membrane protein n=1 Tax=Epilithonimonas sp. UC225_85 TaxID=3350167 RepID=UPI0036D36EF3